MARRSNHRYKEKMGIYDVSSEKEMEDLGRAIANEARAGQAYCLYGPLGAGKSTFARGFIRALQQAEEKDIPSPTFTLIQYYETIKGPLYHFDLYRLSEPDEVFELGWEDAMAESIALIEWPEKAGANLPAYTIRISIEITGETSRRVHIQGF